MSDFIPQGYITETEHHNALQRYTELRNNQYARLLNIVKQLITELAGEQEAEGELAKHFRPEEIYWIREAQKFIKEGA
jgi:hypothetical protein